MARLSLHHRDLNSPFWSQIPLLPLLNPRTSEMKGGSVQRCWSKSENPFWWKKSCQGFISEWVISPGVFHSSSFGRSFESWSMRSMVDKHSQATTIYPWNALIVMNWWGSSINKNSNKHIQAIVNPNFLGKYIIPYLFNCIVYFLLMMRNR